MPELLDTLLVTCTVAAAFGVFAQRLLKGSGGCKTACGGCQRPAPLKKALVQLNRRASAPGAAKSV